MPQCKLATKDPCVRLGSGRRCSNADVWYWQCCRAALCEFANQPPGILPANCRRCPNVHGIFSMQPRQFVTVALLLWLLGVALRLTVLAVPPLIPVIQADLMLSGTEVGLLAGLPVILFAVAALPGSILIARFGALQTLLFGLLLTAAGGGPRGLSPPAPPRFTPPRSLS